MLESALSFSLLFLLSSLVVEAARLAAVHVVLVAAVEESLVTLATRWPHARRAGLVRDGASNAADLAPALADALEADILAHVGAFPGFAPGGRGHEREREHLPTGRLFADMEGTTLTLSVHVCVPAFFLPWSTFLRGRGDGAPGRDCQGRFVTWTPHPSWALRARASAPLPANVSLFERGLGLPEAMPLVSHPDPTAGPLAAPGAGRPFPFPSLFDRTVQLFTGGAGTPVPRRGGRP